MFRIPRKSPPRLEPLDPGLSADIVPTPPPCLKPLDPGLSPEVLAWAGELRTIWAATGWSINRFASKYPIDKGTVSRYLSGQLVPGSHWFLDTLLDDAAHNGKPVTPAVRELLTSLRMRALQTAHPHEYKVRHQLSIALSDKQEAERRARDLEEQLAERNRRIQELVDEKGRRQAAWDAEYERLTQEINQITGQLRLAQEQAAQAERRRQQLEDLLGSLDTFLSADEDSTGARFPVHDPDAVARQLTAFQDMGLDDQVLVLAQRAAAHAPVSDARQLVHLLTTLQLVGATDQACRLARRATDLGRLDRDDMRRLEPRALVRLLTTLHGVGADDLVRRLAVDAVSCAWRGDKDDVKDMLFMLRIAGADDEAVKLARDSPQLQVPWVPSRNPSTPPPGDGPHSRAGSGRPRRRKNRAK